MLARDEAATFGVEPAWDVAKLFPDQGAWSEEEYLMLPGNRLVEYSQGLIEVLPMPSHAHQLILVFLYRAIYSFLSDRQAGTVLVAPLRVMLWAGKFREPDLVVMLHRNRHRIHEQYWDGADLVMEVVSPDDPLRDLETKRREYAQAGIAEYWVVNPIDQTITVFALPAGAERYAVHGVYTAGSVAESVLLTGFTIDVSACFEEVEH